jgi:hypothetical protein
VTDSVHPTIDELADLHAGVSSDSEADRVRAHVDSCADCRAEFARFDEVNALLAAEGSEAVDPMPRDVAQRIDAALAAAAAERADQVTSMATVRERRSARRRGSWVWIAGAAAAAVVVVGVVGLDGLRGSSDDSDSSTAGSAADSGAGSTQLEPEADGTAKGEGNAPQEYRALAGQLTTDSLPRFARQVANGKVPPEALALDARCSSAAPASAAGLPQAQIVWDERAAVLVVDPDTSTASFFRCGTTSEPVYVTSY